MRAPSEGGCLPFRSVTRSGRFRSGSLLLPQWFFTASAVALYCFRSGSSLLPQVHEHRRWPRGVLCKDMFLRTQMDVGGFVDLAALSRFGLIAALAADAAELAVLFALWRFLCCSLLL